MKISRPLVKKYRREIFTRGRDVVRPLVCLLVRPTYKKSVLKISELSARCKRCHLFGFYTKQKAMEKRETQLRMLPQVHLHVVVVARVDIKDGQMKEVNEKALVARKKNCFLFCSLLTYSYLCTRFAEIVRTRFNRELNTILINILNQKQNV